MKKLLALVLAVLMVVSLFAACGDKETTPSTQGSQQGNLPTGSSGGTNVPLVNIKEGEFTYKSYSTSLGSNWNPHTWETNAEQGILGYLETPLVSMSIEDSLNGIYQWIYLAATSVEDVTAAHKDDLTKYDVTLPAGVTAEEIESGYVFEIKLNPNMKWQDGTPINADTYVYSMQMLLNPDMRNYRANLYYAGESAVAGGNKYYNSGAPLFDPIVPPYEDEGDYSYDIQAGIDAGELYFSASDSNWTLYNGVSLNGLLSSYGAFLDTALLAEVLKDENVYGYVKVTNENWADIESLLVQMLGNLFGITDTEFAKVIAKEALFKNVRTGEEYEYDGTVGCYKVDEYTIRYVTQSMIEFSYFLTSCTSNWLVHKETYEAGFDTTGALTTTDYNTSIETTMSYGPYQLSSLQDDKQMIFTRNPYWYDYEKTESGYLYSITDHEVDGEKIQQYQTTRIVIDVMDDNAAKQEFLKGNLSDWAPSADDLPNYSLSDKLYKADDTYTMSFFFNTNVEALKAMDESYGNTNSVVLSNTNFRKAFSLAIERDEWVGATAGYKPTYGLMNNLYYYDAYNNPESSYRNSEPAMQAICDLYGVEYGAGTPYATLRDAYLSITGYNLTEAKNLMKTACEELVAAGLYKEGDPIHIRIGYAKGPMDSPSNQQVELMNKYINAAIEGSGFGKITLEGVGNINDRYSAVPNGEFAIGYGAWGGAAFYPFRNMQVYCDPDQYGVNELGCWDPTSTMLKIDVNGTEYEKSWQWWSQNLVGSGELAGLSNEEKLEITAIMEKTYLGFYYRIPLASSTSCFLMSYQVSYYTPDYNIMYGYGGFELLTYHMDDTEWATYVEGQGGTLKY